MQLPATRPILTSAEYWLAMHVRATQVARTYRDSGDLNSARWWAGQARADLGNWRVSR